MPPAGPVANRAFSPEALILGVDPGSSHTGYGLVLARGSKLDLVSQGRLSPSSAWPMPRRLAFIHQGLTEIISGHRPPMVAVEDIFFGKNARSALKLGQVRGVVLLAAVQGGAEIFEYAPRQVKSSVVGYGQAEKSQVAHMVAQLLDYRQPLTPDAADALALAICHSGQCRLGLAVPAGRPTGGRGWRNLSAEEVAALSYSGKL